MLGAIQRILVEASVRHTATAERLARWCTGHGVPLLGVEDGEVGRAAPDRGIGPSKRTLRLTRHAGAALRPCTGRTDSLLCCNLKVLTQTVGCPLDCSYCILQGYQNREEITVQADLEAILEEVASELRADPGRLHRVCTGQVADSLALEPEVGFAEMAVRRFASLDNGLLELKTKTANVDFLLGLPHGGRTVLSWSLAPPEIIAAEEHGAASLAARLAAAARAAAAGYPVAFHFDPIISLGDDLPRHRAVLAAALGAVPPGRVAYLSLGTVRFPPALRRTMLARFPGTRVTLGELVPEVDGKLRLLAPLRVALYRGLAEEVRRHAPGVFLYLCMEPARIWRRALDAPFADPAAVELALAESLRRRFAL